jgi:PAS domain S-box-containing protein
MAAGDILIVEDERIVAHDLKKDLENFGYTVCGIASCGRDAISMAEEEHPDLVLMDINIKGNIDGIQVAKVMKNRFNVPVIFLTGYADENTLERVKEATPAGYLVKPFKQREVRAAIEIALEKKGAALKYRETWFSTVLQHLADAVLAVDLRGVVTYLNPACEQLVGWSAGEAIGKPFDTIIAMGASNLPASTVDRLRVLLQEADAVCESTVQGKESSLKRVEYTVSALREGESEERGAVFVLRDLSRPKRQI